MLPNTVKSLVKKLDKGHPGVETMGLVEAESRFGGDYRDDSETQQQGVTLTEPLKSAVLFQGQTLFAFKKGEAVEDKRARSLPVSLEEAGIEPGENLVYDPITNEDTDNAAVERVNTSPVNAQTWLKDQYDKDAGSAETSAVALRLIEYHQNEAQRLEAAGRQKESIDSYEQAVNVAGMAAERATRAGQETQAWKLVAVLSPIGTMRAAERKIQAINETLPAAAPRKEFTPEMAKKFVALGQEAQKWGILTDEAKRMAQVTQKVNKGEPLTASDLQAMKVWVGKIRSILGEEPRKSGSPRGSNVILTRRLAGHEISARQRLKAAGFLKAFWGSNRLSADVLEDFSVIGAIQLHKQGNRRYADFAAGMLEEMGDSAKPHLRAIYKASLLKLKKESGIARKIATQASRIQDLIDLWEEKADYLTADLDPETSKTIGDMVEKVKTLSGEAQVEAAQEVQLALGMMEDPTIWRQVSTAQTIAHLLNPKTNVRNIFGNELFFRIERLNKYLATPFDWGRTKLTGGERTVTFSTGGQGGYWTALMRGMGHGWKGTNPGALTTQFDLEMKGPSFRGKYNPLTYMEKAMGATLRGFDYAAYIRAKNQTVGEMAVLTALNRGQKPTQEFVDTFIENVDERVLALADAYGRYVTFQDENFISKSFSELKKILNVHQDFGLGDLVLKYPKTPANLLARALEYSPAGITRSLYILSEPAWKNVEKNPREATLALSRAIVGTGIGAVGVHLVLKGVLTGDDDKDWDVEQFRREQTGEGPYQVNLSALKRWVLSGFNDDSIKKRRGDVLYTYDWMQPIAISLGIGAQLGVGIKEGDVSTTDILQTLPSAIATGTETIFEQPLLSGVRDLFGGRKVTESLGRILVGMPSSFVPTFTNQLRQYTGDNKGRISHDPNPLQKALNRALYKLPYFYKDLPVAFKSLGEDMPREVYQNGRNDLWSVFFSPGFVSEFQPNEAAMAIIRPYDEALERGQFPRHIPYRFRFDSARFKRRHHLKNGLTIELEPEDIARIQRVYAGFVTAEMKKLTRRDLTRMTPTEQAKWLADGVVGEAWTRKTRPWIEKNIAPKYIP